jgi:hypothetical protein
VPNEVFLRTRTGLSAFVSFRAAGRILEGALKGSGQNPDNVDPKHMTTTLLGPVLRELEAVLPRAGMRRNLEKLARSIRSAEARAGVDSHEEPGASEHDEHQEPAGNVPAATPSGRTEAAAGADDAPGDAAWAPSAVEESPAYLRAAWGAEERGADEAVPPAGTQTPLPAAAYGAPAGTGADDSERVPVRRALSSEALERNVQRFAQIEHVRLVATVRQDGSLAASLGDGLDLAVLARISRLALALLAKGGTVRQVHLGHTEGQLFLFPLSSDLLVVFGGADLNLGTVTTAFTALALEEES